MMIDFSRLHKIADNDRGMLINILQLIKKNCSEYPILLQRSSVAKDYTEVRTLAHTLKSSIAYLDNAPINQVLTHLENYKKKELSEGSIMEKIAEVNKLAEEIILAIDLELEKITS